jgi:uncharacterized Zn finger protein
MIPRHLRELCGICEKPYNTSYFCAVPNEAITLSNFRNELDESVLERGWIYFLNGWVKPLHEIMPGYFEAVVEEVNPHAVSFSRNEDDSFTDIFCTCGDKTHKVCRHMAAVIFVLEKKFIDENKPTDWERIEEDSLEPFILKKNNRKKP